MKSHGDYEKLSIALVRSFKTLMGRFKGLDYLDPNFTERDCSAEKGQMLSSLASQAVKEYESASVADAGSENRRRRRTKTQEEEKERQKQRRKEESEKTLKKEEEVPKKRKTHEELKKGIFMEVDEDEQRKVSRTDPPSKEVTRGMLPPKPKTMPSNIAKQKEVEKATASTSGKEAEKESEKEKPEKSKKDTSKYEQEMIKWAESKPKFGYTKIRFEEDAEGSRREEGKGR